jgi:hypothetical protein
LTKVHDAVEGRRNKLISKLIELEQYKTTDGKQLFELSLSDLEYEFYKFQRGAHPHAGMDSIRWRK